MFEISVAWTVAPWRAGPLLPGPSQENFLRSQRAMATAAPFVTAGKILGTAVIFRDADTPNTPPTSQHRRTDAAGVRPRSAASDG